MKIECPNCNHEFEPPQDTRYVIIDTRKVVHKLSTLSTGNQRFGKTLCGKAVDFDEDHIFGGMPGRGSECNICKNMSNGDSIENPDQLELIK